MILKRNQCKRTIIDILLAAFMQTCLKQHFKWIDVENTGSTGNIMHRMNGNCPHVVSLVVGQ